MYKCEIKVWNTERARILFNIVEEGVNDEKMDFQANKIEIYQII